MSVSCCIHRRRLAGAVTVLLLAASMPARVVLAEERLLVFAAASLGGGLQAIATLFEQRTGASVTVSHASSSALARQIEHGAPAGVFVSANPLWMDHLAAAGLLLEDTRFDWLGNRLVVVAATGAASAGDLATSLRDGRIAMGDPEHVPAGIYAREALQHLGLWASVRERAVSASNVRAALVMVARGEAEHGIVYATDARLEPGVSVVHSLPEDSYPPVRYPAAALRPEHARARAFVEFLRSPEAVAVVLGAGFEVVSD